MAKFVMSAGMMNGGWFMVVGFDIDADVDAGSSVDFEQVEVK